MQIDYLLLTLCIGVFITNANNSFISAFFPDFAIKNGVGQDLVGIIFSAEPVGVFFCSLVLGKIMNRKGFKVKCMFMGLLVQSFGLCAMIFLKFISEELSWLFTTVSILARIVQGIGQAMFVNPAYSVIPIIYKSTFESKMGWLESVCGLGLMCGPMLGGIVFQYTGYILSFVAFIVVSLFLMPLITMFVSQRLNAPRKIKPGIYNKKMKLEQSETQNLQESLIICSPPNNVQNSTIIQEFPKNSNNQAATTEIADEDDEDEDQDQIDLQINYLEILSNVQLFLTVILIILPTCGVLFQDPTFQPYLANPPFNVEPQIIGVILTVGTFVYIILCPVGGWLTERSKNIKVLLFFGTLICGIGFIFVGPDKTLTGCPQKLWIVITGDSIIGIGNVFLFIPIVPELVLLLKKLYPDEPEEIIGDLASTIENAAYAIGCFVGPLIGGYMANQLGFPKAAALFGLCIIGFSLIYLVFGGVFCNKTLKPIRKTTSASIMPINNVRIRALSLKKSTISNKLALASPSMNPNNMTPYLQAQRRNKNQKLSYVLVSKKNKRTHSSVQNEKESSNFLTQPIVQPGDDNNNYQQTP